MYPGKNFPPRRQNRRENVNESIRAREVRAVFPYGTAEVMATAAALRKAQELGLAIQMHFVPHFAPQIGRLARKFANVPVLLDHLARAGQGTPADYDQVIALAKIPRVYMKYSGIEYSSKQPFPHLDAKPLVRRAFDGGIPVRLYEKDLGLVAETAARAGLPLEA